MSLDGPIVTCGVIFVAEPIAQLTPLSDQAFVTDVDHVIGSERSRWLWHQEIALVGPKCLDDRTHSHLVLGDVDQFAKQRRLAYSVGGRGARYQSAKHSLGG